MSCPAAVALVRRILPTARPRHRSGLVVAAWGFRAVQSSNRCVSIARNGPLYKQRRLLESTSRSAVAAAAIIGQLPRSQHSTVSSFSTSSAGRADAAATTRVIQNPRVDEDGKPLMIGVSQRAAERLREITDSSSAAADVFEQNPHHHLRITVTSGGCHGFQYMMSLEPASKIDAADDTVFEAEPLQSAAASGEGSGSAKVVMDEPSLELLSGSTVDYTMELIGSQFKIVDNPRATSSCGCGTSFDVKD